MLVRLVAYVGALAPLAIVGIHLFGQLPVAEAIEPSAGSGWSVAAGSYLAFAVSQFDLPEKTETYEILRHPEGALSTRRAAIGCILNRPILLTAGNTRNWLMIRPGRAQAGQLRRDRHAATSADCVTSTEKPLLRGTI